MGVDFSKYQKAQKLMKESNLEEKSDHIIWLRFSKNEAAVLNIATFNGNMFLFLEITAYSLRLHRELWLTVL